MRVFPWTLAVALLAAGPGSAQQEAAPRDKSELEARVVELIRNLDAARPADRDNAEQQLLELGTRTLQHLPEITSPELTAEQRRRLRRILPKLWKQRLFDQVGGSAVSFEKTEMRLSEALAHLRRQTDNSITDMRDAFNQSTDDPQIVLGGDSKKFWKTLDEIVKKASLGYYHFTDDRSVGLQGRQGPGGPVSYSGAFRFELQSLTLGQHYDQEEAPVCSITVGVFMEPKLKPIMIELLLADCTAKDDQGNSLKFKGPERIPLNVEKTAYHLPITLRMEAPPRSSTKLAVFEGRLSVWMPAHTEEFVFDGLEQGKPVVQSTSSLRVSLQGVTNDEGLWTVPVIVEQLLDVGQIDSYLQAALENEIFLRKKDDGTRFDQNGGLSTFGEEPGKLGIEYLFVDAPGSLEDYELVIRIPTGLTAVPVNFSFSDLALP